MKNVTVTTVNGIALATAETRAISLENCIKWYENASGFVVVRYDKRPGHNTQPESLTLNIDKATFDALVATVTVISVLSMSVYDLTSGVATTTVFNQKYLTSLVDSKVYVNGAVDTSVVQVTYEDGAFISKKVYANGTLVSLVSSNLAEMALVFADYPDSDYEIDAVARTIDVTVPYGTNVTALVATFTTSDNITSIKVGGVSQVSAVTANDFTTPKTYVVIAQDGVTTRNWVVTVTVAAATTTTTTTATPTTTTTTATPTTTTTTTAAATTTTTTATPTTTTTTTAAATTTTTASPTTTTTTATPTTTTTTTSA